MTPHYPFSNISSEVGESEVTNAHRLRWCQWTLGHRSGYFVRPKTTKARSMSKMDGGSEATKMS